MSIDPHSLAALSAAVAAVASSSSHGQLAIPVTPACVDEFILAKMDEAKMPGMAASIVRDGEVLWAKAYGYANIELDVPATVDTPFFLASISKTVTGVALMQQRDLGAFQLDDDINDHLGFPVEVPSHPGVPITFRQLMTHTSGIRDNWAWMDPQYVLGDSPLALNTYLADYLSPGGAFYDPVANYYSWAPGSTYSYANQGFALVGLLVETVSGQAFDGYCRQAIFDPLGMDDTGFRLSDFDPNTLAMPYNWNAGAEQYVPIGHYGYPDYPAGTLRSSVMDLSKFLLAIQNDGTYGGAEILDAASTVEMKTVQFPGINATQALAFYYNELFGMNTLGHDGGDPGVLTDMYYRPEDDVGVILLTNGEADFNDYYVIYATLFNLADSLSSEVSRLGTPPNADALLPGVTTGPILGSVWDPVIDHAAFLPGAVLDFVLVSDTPSNIPTPPFGTLLCTLPTVVDVVSSPAGDPFVLPVPENCNLIGLSLCVQGLSVDAGGNALFTNALDITIGTF